MSFYNYNNDTQCPSPGPTTNAVDGLCERTCVQVKKVYDSCMQQVQMEDVTLDLADIQPNDRSFTAPLTFISCRGVPGQTRLSDVSVTRLAQGDNMARVRATMHIPIEVLFSDANGCEGLKNGSCFFTITQDICVAVPVAFGAVATVSDAYVACNGASSEDICTDCQKTPVPVQE